MHGHRSQLASATEEVYRLYRCSGPTTGSRYQPGETLFMGLVLAALYLLHLG